MSSASTCPGSALVTGKTSAQDGVGCHLKLSLPSPSVCSSQIKSTDRHSERNSRPVIDCEASATFIYNCPVDNKTGGCRCLAEEKKRGHNGMFLV